MKYKAPTAAKAGDEDRFTFTVEKCSVAVTFRLIEGGSGVSPPPGPLGIINSPVTGIEQFHVVGVTPCPQSLGGIPISNLSDETVTVNVSGPSPLIVDPASFIMEPGTAATDIEVLFDCSTQSSFTESVTITATTQSGDSQTTTIPVSVAIQQ